MKNRVLLVLSLTLLLLYAGVRVSYADDLPVGPEMDKYAPDFELFSLDGKAVRLSDLRGKPVMLTFWTTWCPSCGQAMRYIQAVFEKMDAVPEDDRVEILAINLVQNEFSGLADVKRFMERTGYNFTVLLDEKSSVANAYRVYGFPISFFIDRDGVIRFIMSGPITERLLWMIFDEII